MVENGESTLLDLVVILLKQRFLIIGVTSFIILLGIIYFFFRPLSTAVIPEVYFVEAEARPVYLPSWLISEIGLDITELSVDFFQDGSLITEAAARHGLATSEMLFTVKTVKTVKEVPNKIILSVRAKDADTGIAFLNDIVSIVDTRLRIEIATRSASVAKALETLHNELKQEIDTSDVYRLLLVSSHTYMGGLIPAISIVKKPIASLARVGPPISPQKTIAIITMAAFFISILLAFVVEYIQRIKSDPESSAKIRKALGK